MNKRDMGMLDNLVYTNTLLHHSISHRDANHHDSLHHAPNGQQHTLDQPALTLI